MCSSSCKHEKGWVCCCASMFYVSVPYCGFPVFILRCQLFVSAFLIRCSLNQWLGLFWCIVSFSFSVLIGAPSVVRYLPSFAPLFTVFVLCSSFSSPQLSVALEEKSSLQAETRSLKEKLSRCDSLDASATAITGKKLLLLQSQMEQLQEENYRSKSWHTE